MEKKEKPTGEGRQAFDGANFPDKDKHYYEQFNFNIAEAGLKKVFDKLEMIAETRQNDRIRKELFSIILSLKSQISESHQFHNVQQQRVNHLKNECKEKQSLIEYLCNYYQLDLQKETAAFIVNRSAIKAIQQSEKTFAAGLEYIKNNFPEHFKTLKNE